jgi:uncharacterized protein (DUF952 family)
MPTIFHLVTPAAWERTGAGPYRAESLASEGFIHCSHRDQVARIANSFFAHEKELLVLEIDVGVLNSPVREEDAGSGERFPHVYGPIDRSAVAAVTRLRRGPDRLWVFPPLDPVSGGGTKP